MKKIVFFGLVTALFIIVFASQAFADNYEPNDCYESACLTSGNNDFTACIENENDVDYYKFVVVGSVKVNISLIVPNQKDYDLKLLDELYNEVGSSTNPEGSMESISDKLLQTGVYYIKVYGYEGSFSSSSYKLNIKTTDVGGINIAYNTNKYAVTSNTSLKNAVEVSNNTCFMAKINKVDESRFYKFRINSKSNAVISLTPPNNTDLDIKLFDYLGNMIGSSANKDGIDTISLKGISQGIYYIKISGYNYAFSNNAFTVSIKTTDRLNEIRNVQADIVAGGAVSSVALLDAGREKKYSDEEISQLTNENVVNTKDVVIYSSLAYNKFMDSAQNIKEIVTNDDIKNLVPDMINSDVKVDNVKNDNLYLYDNTSFSGTIESFVYDSTELADRMIKHNSNIKLWLSFPRIVFYENSLNYIEPYKEKILKEFKQKLDVINPKYWETNIQGFYFPAEDVSTNYTAFNSSNAIDFYNPVVRTMRTLADVIHKTYNKRFLWIPYFGNSINMNEYYNSDRFARIGYIANLTDIFDYVLIWSRDENKDLPDMITDSLVTDINGNVFGGVKTSATKIRFKP
jgi:hypothetical protein